MNDDYYRGNLFRFPFSLQNESGEDTPFEVGDFIEIGIKRSVCNKECFLKKEIKIEEETSSRLVSRSQCSSSGATGISGLHSRCTRGDRHSSRVEAKNPALLSNRDGYLLELTGWTQGSQAS